tara:strand:- start:745 stop:1620 length:876 start_codon:yes stop_codon:yes gene_type:complete
MGDCKVSDQVYTAFDELESNLVEAIQDTINEEVLPPDFKDRMGILMEYTMPQDELQKYIEETDKFKWKSVHKPAMEKKSEGYTNLKEGMENIQVISSIIDALNSRHNTFKGTDEFNKQCLENADVTLSVIIDKEKEDLNKLKNYFISNLDSYKSLYNYQVTIGGLIDGKMKELQKTSNKIDTYKQNLFIDSRKDNYENSNYDFYKSIYFYILLIYYVLLISYIIFTPFFQEKKYLNYKLVIIIVLYIFIPFILPYLLSLIYNVYEYVIEINNLRGEIISYPYIIEDKEKYE